MDELELKEKKERQAIEGRKEVPDSPGPDIDVDLDELEEALTYADQD